MDTYEQFWGYHLILDISGCNNNVTIASEIKKFIQELVPAIGMKAFGEPSIVHFAEHEPAAAGYTLLQMVETSAITGHFSDMNKDAYLDIFSCANFKQEDVIRIVKKAFQPKYINILFLKREAKRPAVFPFVNHQPRQMSGFCNDCGVCCHSDAYIIHEKGISDWFNMHGFTHHFGSEQITSVLVNKLDPDSIKIVFFNQCENAGVRDDKSFCKIYENRPHKCIEFPSSKEQCKAIGNCSFNTDKDE